MIIQGCEILAFDRDHNSTPYRADIRLDGSLIAEIGEGLVPKTGETILDGRGKLVTPGLVNAHLHSQEALFKGRYDNLPLELWMLYAYPILNAQRISPELIYLRTMLVGMEALRNGVTTVVDDVIELPAQSMDQLDAVFRAYDDLGIRANVSGHIINRPFVDTVPFGRHAVPAEVSAQVDAIKLVTEAEYLDYSAEAFSRFHGRSGRLRYVLAPSGPQRVTESLLIKMAELARAHDAQYHIHVLETKMQAETGKILYGRTLVEYLSDIGVLDRHTTLAHSIWVSDEDMRILGKAGASVAHNPIANSKLGAGIAPFRKLLDFGVNVALGSDGLCNGSARMFDVIRMAALLHKVTTPNFEEWPSAEEVLSAATLGGARSCLLEESIGSIEVGKTADLVMYDLNTIPFTPRNDLRNHLVYSEDGSSIDRVFVNGEIVFESGTLTRVDQSAMLEEFRDLAGHALRNHLDVEKVNAAFHQPFVDIHEWASSQASSVNRYSTPPADWNDYGRGSPLYHV